MTTYFHRIRSFNRDIRLFLVTAFLVGFAFDGGIYTVIFNLYLLRLGHDAATIGQINSAGLLTFALLSLPSGFIGKRWGLRRAMIAGLSTMIFGTATIPLIEFIPVVWQVGLLHLAYILIFVGLVFYFVNAAPFVMLAASDGAHDHVFSSQMALLSLAAFMGSLVGGYLPDFFANLLDISTGQAAPYRFPLILAAAFLIPGLLAMRAVRSDCQEEAYTDDESAKSNMSHMAIMVGLPMMLLFVLVIVRFFQVAGIATVVTFFNVYMDTALDAPTTQIGILSAIGRLLAVPAALLTPLLAARKGNVSIIVWASVGTAIAVLPLALVPHWSAAGLGFIGATSLSSMRFPAFLAYSMTVISARHRGTVAGAGEMAAGLSFAVMAWWGGYLIEGAGFQTLFLIGAGFSMLGAVIFWGYFRVPRGVLVGAAQAAKENIKSE